MRTVIGVRFKRAGKIYYFDPVDIDFEQGDKVIVETKRGVEFGTCEIPNKEIPEEDLYAPLKEVIRKADELDKKIHQENLAKAKDAFAICQIKIEEHDMNMKLVGAEYTFDNKKLIFYFTSDKRVDFRNLVRDLAYIFKLRIELRQIGVRDQSKMMGGLGICGRELCCKSFLTEFEPVTINMAKDQDLSLNPTKISGVCGRLMCCLAYEYKGYEENIKDLPNIGDRVDSPLGQGEVVGIATLKKEVRLKLKNEEGHFYVEDFLWDDIKPTCGCNGASCGGCSC